MTLRALVVSTAVLIAVATTGCSQLMGTLRRDLDDMGEESDAPPAPTVGGRWAERGMLSEGGPVGHSERSPASGGYGRRSGPRSWVSEEDEAANRRDSFRNQEEGEEDVVNADNTPHMDPSVKRQYKNGSRATKADFIDESQNEGSLWASDGQTNYYFTKNKVRGVGDIITITTEAALIKDIGLDIRKGITATERDYELNLAQERIRSRVLGTRGPDEDESKDKVASAQAAPTKPKEGEEDKKAEVEIPSPTPADIDVSKSLALKAGDTMLGEIVERYPNGAYKVRAVKQIPYRAGAPRRVVVEGVAKSADIAEDDTIPSSKLYEYRIQSSR